MYHDEHEDQDVDFASLGFDEDFDPETVDVDDFGEPLPKGLAGLDEELDEEL